MNKKGLWGLLVLCALLLCSLSFEAKSSVVVNSGKSGETEELFSYKAKPMTTCAVDSDHKLKIGMQSYGTYMLKDEEVFACKGFYPFMIQVENLSSSPRPLELSFSHGYREDISYRHSLDVPPGETLRSLIFVPLSLSLDNDSSYVRMEIRDRVNGQLYANENLVKSYRDNGKGVNAGITPGMLQTQIPEVQNLCLMEFAPRDNPPDVRFYASMDVFLLTQEEWDMLDASHKGAILDWVNSGGLLMVNNLDKTKNLSGPYGLGEIRACSVDPSKGKAMATFLKNYLLSDEKSEKPPEMRLDAAARAFSFDDMRDAIDLPTGTTMFLLIFVILVGPVNLWVFAPKNRRQKLFVTVPLISLGGSLFLGCYILCIDGIGGKGDREVLVVLSPDSPSAFVSQSQISRSGILTSSDFPMDEYTLMTVHQKTDRDRYSSSKGWGKKGEAFRANGMAKGFFASRSVLKHNLARYVPTRAKVSLVSKPGETPVIQTTLSSPLNDFVYKDASGSLWEAGKVQPGTKVTLSPRKDKTPIKINNGDFRAEGAPGDLAPIETLPAIKWTDHIVYKGRVHVS